RGESYSVPYVEPLSDARTPLADFFNALLGSARRAECRFFVGFAFGNGQGEQVFAFTTRADFEIGNPRVVDLGWEKKLQRVKPEDDAVRELDQREPVV